MVGAGLLARNAVARGLTVAPIVKTSLAPGSKAVTGYLEAAGLMEPLDTLGFALVGYGCTTCIGNSGPLDEPIAAAVEGHDLVVAAVLSGNRNFEGRIHPARPGGLSRLPAAGRRVRARRSGRHRPDARAARASPPTGRPSCWPTSGRRPDEIRTVIGSSIDPELFRRTYAVVFEGDERWRALPIPTATATPGMPTSTYVAKPPFFDGLRAEPAPMTDIEGARVLAVLGDSVTTDHISPAGRSRPGPPPGSGSRRMASRPLEFNCYGARRGHHEVMMRGTFGNIRLRNRLVDGKEGPYTVHLPTASEAFIYDAAMRYRGEGVPLLVIAGRSTGRARRATGPPRARRCSACGPSSPRATSGSIAPTSWAWACCRSSSCPARAPHRWA